MSFDEARILYSIGSILGTDKKSILCPLPQHAHYNHTPSFSVYWKDGVQRWRCHGYCSVDGDVVDLVGFLSIAGYNPHDTNMRIRALEALEGKRLTPTFPTPQRATHLHWDAWKKLTPPGLQVVEYAQKRGLSPITLAHFKVGQRKNYMAMPTFENGLLTSIKVRKVSGGGIRYFSLKGSRSSLFNHDAVAYRSGTVFVVKAEIPAMLLTQMGYLACAPTGGESAKLDRWKDIFVFFDRIIVIGDNDQAGRAGALERAKLLGGTAVFPPKEFKDIDEFILAEPEMSRVMLEKFASSGN